MRCNRAEALPDIADMKANSSNYGSTVPEVTADLLADEPADIRRSMRACESGRDEPDDDGPVRCKWCNGRGTIAVEPGNSLCYRCPDCDGTGRFVPEDEEDEPEETEEDES